MAIAQQLSTSILNANLDEMINFIAVCGAADLGKTHLAKSLVDEFRTAGFSADYLTLDSFLVPRTKRTEQGISGYQLESYDMPAVVEKLIQFKQGNSIFCQGYDHQRGRTDGPHRTIGPCQFLFLDGLHSMAEDFASFVGFSVFMYTDDERLKDMRHRANLCKRGQTEAFSRDNAEFEFGMYKEFVEPYKLRADVLLELVGDWEYLVRE